MTTSTDIYLQYAEARDAIRMKNRRVFLCGIEVTNEDELMDVLEWMYAGAPLPCWANWSPEEELSDAKKRLIRLMRTYDDKVA